MTIVGTAEEHFQAKFLPCLSEARKLADTHGEIIDTRFPSGVPGGQLPEATVFRLMLSAIPLYHAAVAALAEPETTMGSLVLMRSLIEAWTHLFFIVGDGGVGAGCRALRLERGWAIDNIALTSAAGPGMVGEKEKAEARMAEVMQLWGELGCTSGKPRNYSNVGPTTKEIEKTVGIDWLLSMWHTTSQMAHVGGFDWLLVDRGGGTSAFAHPPPSHRASRLNHLVVLFSCASWNAFQILGVDVEGEPSNAFNASVRDLLDRPFLLRAVEGDFD